MISQTISHYKILEKLGEGGMGVVYKAQDTKLDRIVALKFLPPNLASDENDKKRFVHEAKAASALDHPNICNIHEIDETLDGQVFIAMAFYEGTPLNKKIEQGPLKLEEAVDIGIQIAEGLQAAHRKDIIHRDIKSSNVMATASGQIKILDFGLAKRAGATLLTKSGATVGTVPYMSPEQARGEKVDHRTDIWSLGIVLYEMITGRLPFRSDYNEALVYSILNEDPPPPTSLRSDVPMELERIVKKAMQKEHASRYQHVDEMVTDLRALKQAIMSGREGAAVSRARPSLKKRTYTYLSLGVIALVMIAVALLTNLQPTREKFESLAVLPLENMGRDPDQEYFADGMTEALITELSKISALRVISRTSAMQYKGVKKPLPQIARELNVDALIEGSVLREGDQVRITVQLIHGSTDKHLWAESYQRELRGILALQSEVARAIAGQIKVAVTPEEKTRLASSRAVNPEAHEAYLKGRFYWNKRTKEGLKKALELFQRAIEADPGDPLAYAGLADAYAYSANQAYLRPNEAFPKAKAAALKALEIDDHIAEGHTSLGFVKFAYDMDWSGAEREFQRAIQLNPSYSTAHAWYSIFMLTFLRFDESIAELHRAQQLDPLSVQIAVGVGSNYNHARQYDRAILALQRVAELDPNVGTMYHELGFAYLGKGMYPEAIRNLQKAVAATSRLSGDPLAMLGYAYGLAGQKDQARKILEQLKQQAITGYVQPTAFALVCVGLGDKDQAIAWLEKAYAEERGIYLTHLKVEPP
ncbi:MAG: protein kinase, partial [Ignavibacteriales bacterium]|nr:protein kinase [Ignavibacteriales bacterium]